MRVRGEDKLTDEAFLGTLNSSLYQRGIRFKVIQFNGREGIVRVNGKDRDRALEALNEADGSLTTLRISGTLKTLREGALGERAPGARP